MPVVDWLENHDGLITALATVVLTLTTIYYAVVTKGLLEENRKLRLAGDQPNIVGYLHPHREIGGIVDISIENVGHGPAFDLSIKFDGDEENLKAHNGRISFAISGANFQVFPQSYKLTMLFGPGPELLAGEMMKDFELVFAYRSGSGKNLVSRSRLSVRQFAGMVPENNSLARKISDTLGEISATLKKLGRT